MGNTSRRTVTQMDQDHVKKLTKRSVYNYNDLLNECDYYVSYIEKPK